MQNKHSQKRTGSSRYIVEIKKSKRNLSLELILLRICKAIDSPDRDSSRMQPR